MKCRKARKILNSIFDGEAHPQAENAKEHMRLCRACMEWYTGMEQAIVLIEMSGEDVPNVDISPLVMSRLPARHPASQRAFLYDGLARRFAFLLGAFWLAGLVLLIPVLLQIKGDTLAHAVIWIYGSIQTCAYMAAVALRIFTNLITPMIHLGGALWVIASSLEPLVVKVLALDIGILLVVLMGWSRLRKTSVVNGFLI